MVWKCTVRRAVYYYTFVHYEFMMHRWIVQTLTSSILIFPSALLYAASIWKQQQTIFRVDKITIFKKQIFFSIKEIKQSLDVMVVSHIVDLE